MQIDVGARLFRPLNEHAHVYVLPLHAQPGREVVYPNEHGPSAMCAALVAKQIEPIGARTQPKVPWLCPESWIFIV